MSTRQLMRKHGISLWRLPRLVRRYQSLVAEEADKLKLAAGLPAALSAISGGGMRLGILSSNREDNVRRCLRANAAEGHFAFVVGYPRLFGKDKAFKRILRAERLHRDEVLDVGDEFRDVEVARKADVKVAPVTWGFHTAELLRSGAPDYVVSEASELVGPALSSTCPGL